jgi:peptide-methionine (S)-S-oxide reductase
MNEVRNVGSIVLGGGCFWCLEAVFDLVPGVESVVSGYSGGHANNPTYEEVCSGITGHAEVIQVSYDLEVIKLQEILEIFFSLHDPTTLNRQGPDTGTQYRSIAFFNTEEERSLIDNLIKEINSRGPWEEDVVTEVVPANTFFIAEEEHQKYYVRNRYAPYCQIMIDPKVEKFQTRTLSHLSK